ncbi:cytochrome P450 [Pseudoalteromonas sp. SMS1]|uniref:cytochrome P450 n=1 Tax=Pseudoalteromonas sp. SMS1 TaxID=2908894 RepID=UPI001F4124DD|nr:cytochrome P450 [Pseudoalteromonas sp. SMS1]MCF2857209.1 cytochrome P450 [Pseudoalteromonas sp. SMS1]
MEGVNRLEQNQNSLEQPVHVALTDVSQMNGLNLVDYIKSCVAQFGNIFTLSIFNGPKITLVQESDLFSDVVTKNKMDINPELVEIRTQFEIDNVFCDEPQIAQMNRDFVLALKGKKLEKTKVCYNERLDFECHKFAERSLSTHKYCEIELAELQLNTMVKASLYSLFGEALANDQAIVEYFNFSESLSPTVAKCREAFNVASRAKEKLLLRLEQVLVEAQTPLIQSLNVGLFSSSTISQEDKAKVLLYFLWGSLSNILPSMQSFYRTLVQHRFYANEIRANPNFDMLPLIKEVLRLRGNKPIYRLVESNIMIQGTDGKKFVVPKGHWLGFISQIHHQDEQIFSEPNKFDPSRFCKAFGFTNSPKPPSLFVYGVGNSKCPGSAFANHIMASTAVYWLKHFDAKLWGSHQAEAMRMFDSVLGDKQSLLLKKRA